MKTYNERINSINAKVKQKRKRRAAIWTAGSVACVLLVLTVVCSLPILGEGVPNVNAYKNDEYYKVIEKINSRYSDNRYSVFEQIGNTINKGFGATAPTDPAPGDSSNENDNSGSSGEKYEETTNNQVDGVIEGDLLKRSTSHAFYIKNGYSQNAEPCLLLQVYRLAGSDTELVAEYYVRPKDNTSFSQYSSYIQAEMFLSDDATRLTVLTTCLSSERIAYTTVISLDVSNVNEIAEVNRVYVSGAYLSSRKADGKLLVVTNFNLENYGYYGYNSVDYDKKETYVPQCGGELGNSFIPASRIHIPDKCSQINYTVLAMLDETTLNVDDSYAVFAYSKDVYVSQDYIAVMRNSYYYYGGQFDYGNEIDSSSIKNPLYVSVCEIVVLSYKNGFDKKGEIGLDGFVKDRYSMDEKDGIFRVFTTVNQSRRINGYASSSTVNVSLYCVDLNSMQIVASKERFAPSGDEVKSARFDKDYAYVCTARRNTDPVFYFDLTDLNNIIYVDTGEIEGFSNNLIKFNDLLLGIGQGEHSGILKIELYRQSDDANAESGVESVCKYERECRFSYEYKAHFVNAEHNLIGLHVYDYENNLVTNNPNVNRNKYLLLHYDSQTETLEQAYFDVFDSGSDYVRAFYADNGVYVFGTNAFTFIDLQ